MNFRTFLMVFTILFGLLLSNGCGDQKLAARKTMLAFFKACQAKDKTAFSTYFDSTKVTDAALKKAQAAGKKSGFPMLPEALSKMKGELSRAPENLFFALPSGSWDKAAETLAVKEDDADKMRATFSNGIKSSVCILELNEKKDWVIIDFRPEK
ncbi:MAG: hypothetical protein HQM09_17985 [Candidatus Riflebacteria bacterium]|nr:hypothetical protein [Candidatus Riflebacteria bacterium]